MASSGSKSKEGSDSMIVVGELSRRNLMPMFRACHRALLLKLRGMIQRIDQGIQNVVQSRHGVSISDSSIFSSSPKDSVGVASMAGSPSSPLSGVSGYCS